jgi:hypothetical protein
MNNSWIKTIPILLFLGCGSNSDTTSLTSNDSNTSKQIIGYLIDSAVEGCKYVCAETTAFTNEEGKFICSSFPIRFYIGELFLGDITELPSDSKVFPQDIVGVDRNNTSHPEVIKLATLFQSLDNDNNLSNDINITTQTNASFENDESNTSLTDTSIPELEAINNNVTQLAEEEVEEHLTQSTNDAALPNGYTFPVINNQGQAIETILNDYTIKLYANYQEKANAQRNHQGVVVKINSENSPKMAIQSTYEGKSIVAGAFKEGKVIAVSSLLSITNASLFFIKIEI